MGYEMEETNRDSDPANDNGQRHAVSKGASHTIRVSRETSRPLVRAPSKLALVTRGDLSCGVFPLALLPRAGKKLHRIRLRSSSATEPPAQEAGPGDPSPPPLAPDGKNVAVVPEGGTET